jgi:hypothetical protein
MKRRYSLRFCARTFVLALATVTICAAQQQPAANPQSLVTVVRIKPDMLTEWLDLQKNEVNPAQKKAGVKSRTVLQTVLGNGFEYTILTPYAGPAEIDAPGANARALGAEAAARLAAKIRKCVEQQRTFIITNLSDLAVPAGDAAAYVSNVRRAAPGKQDEYLNYLKTEIVPVMKKAKADVKIAGYTVNTRGVGAATAGEIVLTTYYNKFADTAGGAPLVKVLGQEAADKVNAKGAGLSVAVQNLFRRRVADLSF